MPIPPSPPGFAYHAEDFTDSEREVLRPYFTRIDGPVFALTNLPEVVKGAIFARYSRSPHSLRRLFLDEFVANPELGIQSISAALPGDDPLVRIKHAETLYRRIFSDYGDDSVAQLGGVHLACEQASNLLTKVLEWGRLAAYLEQSTRYIRYDQLLGNRWRYYVPPEVMDTEWEAEFRSVMDGLFSTYSRLAQVLTQRFESSYPQGQDSEGVWRATLRAKACDVVRGLLPVSTLSNVGIYANGQAFESLILRMRSLPIVEARQYSELMLAELRTTIPAFMARVDAPDKGVAATRYMTNTRAAMEALLAKLNLPSVHGDEEFSVDLVDWDRDGEDKIIADALYSLSNGSASTLRQHVNKLSETEKALVFNTYVGERQNRRHKPGRAFEAANYHFDIVCDYANFRDLQRHRLLTIDWQRLSFDQGFTTPKAIAEIGAEGEWSAAIQAAQGLHTRLCEAIGPDAAQYAIPFASRIRFYLRLNAREAMHLIELRTGRGGHTQYRQVCQKMLELIQDKAGHKAVARALAFADRVPDYELARLDGERRAERKRMAAADGNMAE